MDETSIKDCPYCGGMWWNESDEELETLDLQTTRKCGETEKYNIVCNCGVEGPFAPTRDIAVLRWNNMPRKAAPGNEERDKEGDTAQAVADRNKALEEALKRLGSMEPFTVSFSIPNNAVGQELTKRISFAREALKGGDS
ncbi:hypothetical protein [Cohaesibacter marisflavi]|uniref:hypothetical protein n=1 Tax=Cohaesibacter marisflavi TaxID=655353 RepID=UPI0029C6430B|nr:hypothetical protein [Cohaesibacter marisflavi]